MIAVWVAPQDSLTRYHAWQGSALVILTYLALIVFGLLAKISDAAVYLAIMGLLSGLTLLAALTGIVWGIIAAAMGRYVRLRPVWDLLTLKR